MKILVLVIEDNHQNRYLLRFLLEKRGYEVEEAIDGPQGIEMARARRPDLILLDIQLPGMDGLQVADALRAAPDLAEIPIVAVTSHAMAGDRERILAHGFAGYLEKPIDPARFPGQIEPYVSIPNKARGQGVVVLVVDDKDDDAYYLRSVLEAAGHRVIVARDGEEALALARQSAPDVVVSDILMPRMDGFSLCRTWKSDPSLRDVPFVVYTATYTDDEDERLARDLGADLFVRKPQEPAVLVERVREVLSGGPRGVARSGEVEHADLTERYNDALVRKLEDKVQQLARSNEELTRETALREQAQRETVEAEMRLSAFVASSSDHIFLLAPDGTVEFSNRGGESFGVEPGVEVVGRAASELLGARVGAVFGGHLRDVVERGAGAVFEYEVTCSTGMRRHRCTMFPIVREGEVTSVGGIGRDVTEEHSAVRALRDSEASLRTRSRLGEVLLRSADDELMHRALEVTAGALDSPTGLCGVLDDVGNLSWSLWPVSGGRESGEGSGVVGQGAVGGVAANTLREGRAVLLNEEAVLLGSLRVSRALTAPLMGQGGVIGLIVVANRATEYAERDSAELNDIAAFLAPVIAARLERDRVELARREAEALGERTLEQLRQAQKMEAVGRLAGGVAHDFNNILTAIVGHCDLMRLDPAVKRAALEDIEGISKSAERAAALTRRLLAFSRKQVLQPTVLSLNDVVADLDTMLRRLVPESIEIVASLEGELDLVDADASQLELVIMNLVVNARDAMSEGGTIRIRTANVAPDAADLSLFSPRPSRAGVVLDVSDTGCGIEPEALPHIFEPFFTTKPRGIGTGLGLSTVQGILEQCGGAVAAHSAPGAGTTVRAYLPRAARERSAHPYPTAAQANEKLRGSETVLLVEDDDAVRWVVANILEEHGYEVLATSNAEEAMRKCETDGGRVAVAVTDIVMPGMSGRDLGRWIASHLPHVRTLFMSGYLDDGQGGPIVISSEVPFIQKPFTPNDLLRAVRALLDRESR